MDRIIRGYYHVSFLNDWYDITKYIFDEMSDSGLLADCDRIFVGALGDEANLPKLKELISFYPKIELRDWDGDLRYWEGFTMRHLRHDADSQPPFYALYCHSKSCTRGYSDTDIQKDNDKKSSVFWMRYMVYAVITRWRDNYKALSMPDIGYDVAACRMIPKRISASQYSHASGNFWMASSEYIKTIPKIVLNERNDDTYIKIKELQDQIDELRKTASVQAFENIFMPEEILWHSQPLTYIACNAFTVGFPYQENFEEMIQSTYPIHEYCTRP